LNRIKFTPKRFLREVKRITKWIEKDNIGRKEKIYFSPPKIKVYKTGGDKHAKID